MTKLESLRGLGNRLESRQSLNGAIPRNSNCECAARQTEYSKGGTEQPQRNHPISANMRQAAAMLLFSSARYCPFIGLHIFFRI
jgi:hypothetical protein